MRVVYFSLSLGAVFFPASADPEGFVILDRADLEPYFPDYMPTKNIQLLILALLESFRRKNA